MSAALANMSIDRPAIVNELHQYGFIETTRQMLDQDEISSFLLSILIHIVTEFFENKVTNLDLDSIKMFLCSIKANWIDHLPDVDMFVHCLA